MLKIYHFIFYQCIFFFFLLSNVNAQIPPNDLCEDAIELSYAIGACDGLSFDLENASATTFGGCGSAMPEVWYKLEMPPEDLALQLRLYEPINTNIPSLTIYIGDCDNLQEYACLDDGYYYYLDTLYYILSDPSLAGEDLFIKAFSGAANNFEICAELFDISNQHLNCQTAKEIFLADSICDPSLSIIDTLFHFWNSTEVNCNQIFNFSWYEILIPANTRIGIEVQILSSYVGGILYDSYNGSCNNLNFQNCDFLFGGYGVPSLILENSENVEQRHYFKIGTEIPVADAIVELCAKKLIPLENEICESASEITFSNYPDCGPVTRIDFSAVVHEEEIDIPSCSSEIVDVWFRFDDGDTTNAIVVNADPLDYDYTPIFIELYNGSDCTDLTLIECIGIYFDSYASEFVFSLPEMDDSNWFIQIGLELYFTTPEIDICFSIATDTENDDCLDAKLIDIDGPCVDLSNLGSTNSNANICNSTEDVWFKFVYEGQEFIEIIIDNFNPGYGNLEYAVSLYRGSCDQLNLIECNSSNNGSISIDYFLKNPDLIGQMIYVAVNRLEDSNEIGSFKYNVCVNFFNDYTDPFDYCSIGREIEVSTPEMCNNTTDFLSFWQNGYSGIGNYCHMENIAYDGWVNFTVPENGLFEMILNIADPNELSELKSISFYSGECSNPILITCLEIGEENNILKKMNFASFANQNVHVQFLSGNSFPLEMDLCIIEVTEDIAPYDNCPNALFIESSTDFCSNPIVISNVGSATSENGISCPGFAGNDIWFSFIVPESGILTIECGIVPGSSLIDGGFAIYQGDCGALSLIACDDDSGIGSMPAYSINDSTLANQELWLQFWSFNGAEEGAFSICVFEPDQPLGNDCTSAIDAIRVAQENCYTNQDTKVQFASNTFSGIVPDCTNDIASDIWFKFEYKKGERLVFEFKQALGSLLFDGKAAIYRQSCDELIFIDCNDDNGPGNMPSFDLEEVIDSSWNEDQTFYIQFWDFNQGVGGEILYCLYDKGLVNNENPMQLDLTIMPNPFSNELQINIGDLDADEIEWSIMDLSGKTQMSGTCKNATNDLIQINTGNLVPSSYFISLKSANYHLVEKIVKF